VKTSPSWTFALLASLSASRAFALELPADSLRLEAPPLETPGVDFYAPPPEVARYWEEPADAGRSATGSYLLAEARMAAALIDDFQFGARLDVHTQAWKYPLGFLVDFEGRPYGKAVRVRESETLEYQFREHRFTVSPGVSLSLPVDRGEGWWTFATGVGLSFGTYRGAARAAETTFPVWFEAGYRAKIGEYQYLGLAYQYFPLPDVSPHRISVQWGLRSKPQNSSNRESP
jgi:hypothetical protein